LNIVKVGDLWEAEERLFWIVGLRRSIIPGHSIYEYFEIRDDRISFQTGHLTIQRDDLFHGSVLITDYWKKVA